jgi:hypothetical protein
MRASPRAGQFPLKLAKFRESREFPIVHGDNADSLSARTHRNQSVIGETFLANLFVIVFGRKPREYISGIAPILQVRNYDSACLLKIVLQPLNRAMGLFIRAGIKFFEDNRTQP